MSFEDYAQYMKQKFKLAVAIAVIKNKPSELTNDEYITELRKKLIAQDEMELDELNISLRSEDFDLTDKTNPDTTQNKTTFDPTQDSIRITNESPTILRDFIFDGAVEQNGGIPKSNSIDDTINVLNEITGIPEIRAEIITTNNMQEISNLYFIDDTQISLNLISQNAIHINNTATNVKNTETTYFPPQNMQNQETLLKENHVNAENQNLDQTQTLDFTQTCTHVSQSQNIDNRFQLLDKYVLGVYKTKKPAPVTGKNEKNSKNIKENSFVNQVESEINDLNEIRYDFEHETNDDPKTDSNFNIFQENGKSYTVLDVKNVSKERMDAKNMIQQNNIIQIEEGTNIPTQTYADIEEIVTKERMERTNIIQQNNIIQIEEDTNIPTQTYADIEEILTKERMKRTNIIEQNNIIHQNNITQTEEDTNVHTQIGANTEEMVIEEIFDSQSENPIPFKVITDLNKIKTKLYKKTERRISSDSDSGYRSDSQNKSGHRSGLQSQTDSNWLNQAGHTVFNHLLTYPLHSNTIKITNEISEVVGDLVDKLHNEEMYPQFLDEILDNIKKLLEEICEDECNTENGLITKDEKIHRLLLLNRSYHINAYTIDKIAAILEEFHKNLSGPGEIYEITDGLEKLENVSYVFHVLEILLQRYLRKKGFLASQGSSQTTQVDDTPKKYSITEIWKRKWDPEFKKKDIVQNSLEETSVSTRIGDILNRMVVDCMDGYSLVSFAALQCFNIMQS